MTRTSPSARAGGRSVAEEIAPEAFYGKRDDGLILRFNGALVSGDPSVSGPTNTSDSYLASKALGQRMPVQRLAPPAQLLGEAESFSRGLEVGFLWECSGAREFGFEELAELRLPVR